MTGIKRTTQLLLGGLVLLQAIACAALSAEPTVDTTSPVASADINAGVVQGETAQSVCTSALTGRHATFEVGPGRRFEELDSVPFGSLVAGDVVNIYYRPNPYKSKFGLRARGTAAKPVVINGVTDASCNKPTLDFDGAKTARGSNLGVGYNVFGDEPKYNEGLGGIVIKRGPSGQDAYGVYEPEHIIIQGLSLHGARKGATYDALGGTHETYGSSACIWVQSGQDITIRNNVITDCALGIFFMAKDDLLSETTVRTTIANNRVYGHGVDNSYSEHGFYVQAANPVVEGNFIGKNRKLSSGSSYKSRSSGEIFRHNYVECTALCIDFVQSEEQAEGIVKRPDYGTDYVYSNTIVSVGPPVIHYGGDNRGEQSSEGVTSKTFVPEVPYRRHLRFWDNNFILDTSEYRTWIFRLSEKATEVDAWNNTFTFRFKSAGQLSWLLFAGQLRLGPGNKIIGPSPVDAQTEAGASTNNYAITKVGEIPSDPKLSELH